MLNRAEIIGHLGQDPDVRTTQNGDQVANLSVATTERWTTDSGGKQERTEWHRVTVWGNTAGVVERFLKKGSKVYLAGKLQTRKWQDQQGNDRYTTEIVVRPPFGQMEMLDGKQDGAAKSGSHQAPLGDPVDEIPF